MIRIIKEGNTKIHTCRRCGCEFSYEKSDMQPNFGNYGLHCPQCGIFIYLFEKSKTDIDCIKKVNSGKAVFA